MLLSLALGAAACSSGPADRVAASTPVVVDTSVPPLPPDGGALPVPSATATSSGRPSPVPVPTRVPSTVPRPTATPAPPDDPLSPRPPLESPPPAGRPACAPSTLTVTDADRAYDTDAVRALYTVRTSGPDCQLPADYPQVSVLDAAGASLGPVARGGTGLPQPGSAPVTLSRTTSLSFFVSTGRNGACTPAATLTVVLPGTTGALTVATTLPVCDGRLAVGPVQRLGDGE